MANDGNDVQKKNDDNPIADLLSDPTFAARLSQIAAELKAGMTATEAKESSPPKESPTPASAGEAESPAPSSDGLAAVLSNPELMSKLPDVIATLGPMIGGTEKKPRPDKRTALLLALRPYLSPGRCEAIDYITKIGKLSDLFKNLKL